MVSTSLRISSIKNAEGKSQIIIKLTITRHYRPCIKTYIYVDRKYFKPVRKSRNGKGLVYDIVPPKRGKNNQKVVEELTYKRKMVEDIRKRLEIITEALSSDNSTIVKKVSILETFELTRNNQICGLLNSQLLELFKKRREEEKRCEKNFSELTELYLKQRCISEDRKKSYRVLFRAMMRYQGFIRHTKKGRKDFTIGIDSLDEVTIDDFFIYLIKEKELEDKYPKLFTNLIAETGSRLIEKRGANTIVYHKKRLKAFWHWLLDKEFTKNDPVKDLKTGTAVYGTPYFITIDERNKISVANLEMLWNRHLIAITSGNEEKVKELPLSTLLNQRDIFIFQCLTGCRYGDLIQLTKDNIQETEYGLVLSYIPSKTKNTRPILVRVPLLKQAQELIAKYKGKDPEGRLFPFISGQKYNQALKQIFRLCGLTYKIQVRDSITGLEKKVKICDVVSSHMARRTFIGILYNKVKDPCIICSMTGHAENSKAFYRYRQINMDIKRETIQEIA